MSESRSCFVCSTSFQLITVLQICFATRERADLYILPMCPQADFYAEQLRKTGLFQRVSSVSKEALADLYAAKKPLKYNLISLKHYLSVRKTASRIVMTDCHYDKFYYSSVTPYSKWVQLFFFRHSPDTESLIFDDGEGSYDDPYMIGKLSKADALARRLLFSYRRTEYDYRRLLYSPELFRQINGNRYKVEKIENRFDDPEFRRLVNRAFDYREEYAIREKFLILDVIKDVRFSESGKRKLAELYRMVLDAVGSENLIIKKHPRDTEPSDGAFRVYQNQGLPLEIIEMNSDMQNKVVISAASTAVFTAKALLNQEPRVIVLERLFEPEDLKHNLEGLASGKIRRFHEGCASLYADKSRYMIPESVEEFRNMLCATL